MQVAAPAAPPSWQHLVPSLLGHAYSFLGAFYQFEGSIFNAPTCISVRFTKRRNYSNHYYTARFGIHVWRLPRIAPLPAWPIIVAHTAVGGGREADDECDGPKEVFSEMKQKVCINAA